jgi:trk system potassium uptake protein
LRFTFFIGMIFLRLMKILMIFWQQSTRKINPPHILAISFLLLILFGSWLLQLPVSCTGSVSYIDALFISTSATCVTGLSTIDIGTRFTGFGQIVVLILIQLGGLGFMTLSTFFIYILAGRFSIKGRDLIEQSVASQPLPYLGKLLVFTVTGTAIIEACGGIVLSWRFADLYPWSQAIYLGFFHSISAFCNAGFSVFPDNLMAFRHDLIVNSTVMTLIVLGGLGFWVIYDLHNLRGGFRKLTLHSKIVLTTSFFLIVIGALFIAFFDWHTALNGDSIFNRFLASTFQSVSARTAGYNTLMISEMSHGSLLVLMILMGIGASPGSCGGGVKTSTFAVLLAAVFSRLHDQRQIRLFNRGIPEEVISKAMGIVFFWLAVVISAVMVLLVSESDIAAPFQQTLLVQSFFESLSAIGTVGLSMGITPYLSIVGKIVIIVLMYVGRIGPITLAVLIASNRSVNYRFAEEKVIVG